jgi:crossover junction endodeoxyribonuclease RusA
VKANGSVTGQETIYPLEFVVPSTPVSLQASSRSKERWKSAVREAARERIRETDPLGFLDRRPLGLTIYYFSALPMEGDIDNIVKPIMDALIHVACMTDNDVERVVVQKFEPAVARAFSDPSAQLVAALDVPPPAVYVRIDDDLSWRLL